jgi:GNAT superfamily N-acetyltransferase
LATSFPAHPSTMNAPSASGNATATSLTASSTTSTAPSPTGSTRPRPSPAAGWRCAPGQPGQEEALLTFLNTSFPGRWHWHLADSVARGASIEDVTLLLAPDDTVSGFAATWHFASPLLGPSTNWHLALGPRFGGLGPLGIAASARGHGRGLALVAAATTFLYQRGVIECAIDWTTLLDFYARLGFTPWRSYWRCAPKSL